MGICRTKLLYRAFTRPYFFPTQHKRKNSGLATRDYAWLKDAPFPKTARVSKVRDNETNNEECDVEEADYQYSTSDDSMSEADEAETIESLQDTDYGTETILL